MIIYRDDQGEPEYIAYVAPSDFGQVRRWLRDNHCEMGPDLMYHDPEMRAFAYEVSLNTRCRPPCPSVWYVHRVQRQE
jgi:hypothetical protein